MREDLGDHAVPYRWEEVVPGRPLEVTGHRQGAPDFPWDVLYTAAHFL